MMPPVSFEEIDLERANACLRSWNHKMGPLERPFQSVAYALFDEGQPCAIAIHSTLIRDHVGGGLDQLTRANTIELSRLCAERAGLCRVALRLWREFVFPKLGYSHAISYQDADLHNGNTYRFDGWRRAAYSRAGGIDRRSGRKGRNKWIWVWSDPCALNKELIDRRLSTAESEPARAVHCPNRSCRARRESRLPSTSAHPQLSWRAFFNFRRGAA